MINKRCKVTKRKQKLIYHDLILFILFFSGVGAKAPKTNIIIKLYSLFISYQHVIIIIYNISYKTLFWYNIMFNNDTFIFWWILKLWETLFLQSRGWSIYGPSPNKYAFQNSNLCSYLYGTPKCLSLLQWLVGNIDTLFLPLIISFNLWFVSVTINIPWSWN